MAEKKMAQKKRGAQVGKDWSGFTISWADDELISAHHLSQMLRTYGEVEELIALGSMSQDDLAHARLLYSVLGLEPREQDRLFFERDPDEFRSCLLLETVSDEWAVVVMRQYLYEVGEAIRLEAVEFAGPPVLKDACHAMVGEETLHRTHWEHWCKVIAQAPKSRARLQRALDQLWLRAEDLFDAPDGVAWDRDDSARRWRAGVTEFLSAHSLAPTRDNGRPLRRTRTGPRDAKFRELLEQSRRVYREDEEAVWG